MKQREALNELTLDIIRISKRKNKVLTVFLAVSVALNLLLVSMLFQVSATHTEAIDSCGFALTAVAMKKPSDHIQTRQKLKDIYEVKTFEDLLERCILTDDDKFILREHYLHGRSFQSIAMQMGYSEDALKHKHQRILKKIKKIL